MFNDVLGLKLKKQDAIFRKKRKASVCTLGWVQLNWKADMAVIAELSWNHVKPFHIHVMVDTNIGSGLFIYASYFEKPICWHLWRDLSWVATWRGRELRKPHRVTIIIRYWEKFTVTGETDAAEFLPICLVSKFVCRNFQS